MHLYRITRRDGGGFPETIEARDAWYAWMTYHATHFSAQRRHYTVRRQTRP
jgi:hypothetical protein